MSYDMIIHNDNCVQPHTTKSVVVQLQQVNNDDKDLALGKHLNENSEIVFNGQQLK